MVNVSEGSALAAHRGRGRARFDSPARRRAPRRTAAERHARGATAGGATVAPGCAMDSGGVVRGRGESAFPTRKTAAWNRVLSAAVGGWVWNSTSADRTGKQSSSARKMFPRTSPIDPTRCRDSTDSPATGHCVARERGGGPRTLPVAHSRATPASPSPRSAHPASVVRPHAQTEASSRGGKFLNSTRSSARGVSLRPTGFRARGHREKTRRRRLRGASTLNRRAHSSRGEYPLLYTHHGAAHW